MSNRDDFASIQLEKNLVDWDQYYPREYTYVFPTVARLVGAFAVPVSVDSQLQIQQDAPFVITARSVQVWTDDFLNLAAGANTPLYAPDDAIFDIDVQFFDSGASNFTSNSPIPLRAYMGSAGKDRQSLPVPYMIEQNTFLKGTFTSRDTRTVDIRTVLFGYKIIQRPSPVKNAAQKAMDQFSKLNRADRVSLLNTLAAQR